MRVGYLVPGRPGEIGSVQIYAENLSKAFSSGGEPDVKVYYENRDLATLKRDIIVNMLDIIQVENRPLRLPQIKRWISCAGSHAALVLNLHSLNFVEHRRVGLQKMARALSLADAIVVNSRAVKRRFVKLLPREGPRAKVVYPGVDPSAFTPRPEASLSCLKAKDGVVGRNPVILFAGRLVKRKGLTTAIKAVRLLRKTYPDAILLVAGGKRPSNSNYVVYAGKLSHDKMPHAYSLADVLICPSQQFEAFGLVNVEAMAQGLPVVASRQGGIPEIVRHGVTGYLVDNYRSPASFARYLGEALNPERKETLGITGRKIAMEHFQWEHTKNGFTNIYKGLLEVATI